MASFLKKALPGVLPPALVANPDLNAAGMNGTVLASIVTAAASRTFPEAISMRVVREDAGCGIGTGAEGVGPALHFGSEGGVALGRPDARDGRHGRLCPDVQPIRGCGVGGDGTRLFCGEF